MTLIDTRPNPRTREEHDAQATYLSDRRNQGYRLKKWSKDFYGRYLFEWEKRK